MALSTFALLNNHHTILLRNSSPKTDSNHPAVTIHFPLPLASGGLRSTFCFCGFAFWMFHISEIIQCVFGRVWCISLSITSSRFIRVVATVRPSFLPFYGRIIARCMYMPRLVYPLSCDDHLGCYHHPRMKELGRLGGSVS